MTTFGRPSGDAMLTLTMATKAAAIVVTFSHEAMKARRTKTSFEIIVKQSLERHTVSPRTRSSGVWRARTSLALPPSISTSAGRGFEL